MDERRTVTLSNGALVTVSGSQFTLLGASEGCVAHRFEIAHVANAALTEWSREVLSLAEGANSSRLGVALVSVPQTAKTCKVINSVAEEVRTARIADLFNELEASLLGTSGVLKHHAE